ELARQADGEVADVDHLLYLAMTLGADFAHLQTDEIAERLFQLAQAIGQVADNRPPARSGHIAPTTEGVSGAIDYLLIDGRRRLDDGGNRLTRGRIGGDEALARRILEPAAGAGTCARIDFGDVELLQDGFCIHGRPSC